MDDLFAYEFQATTDLGIVQKALTMPAFKAQYIGTAGAVIEKDISSQGLQRIKISAWSLEELLEAGQLVMTAATPNAQESLRIEPIYPDLQSYGSVVGWIFYTEAPHDPG